MAFFNLPPSEILAPEASKEKWAYVETHAREAMRLRRLAYSTEKTYVAWLWSFSGFVADKTPEDATVADIEDSSRQAKRNLLN